MPSQVSTERANRCQGKLAVKSIDEKREKLKVRRMIDGRRLEVLHLPADVPEPSL